MTLIELLVVMAIVALVVGIAYPNVTSGLDGIRLKTAADRAGSFWSAARQRADRYQEVVQVVIDPAHNELRAASVDGRWRDALPLGPHLFVSLPDARAAYLLYPGTPSPRFELLLEAGEDSVAGVRVNILTGVPEPWDGPTRAER
jgi:prepilin-type N-terminal cleavage/methylation domain-containing protein